MKLTKAQRSLCRVVAGCDIRGITRAEIDRRGLKRDFLKARVAGLIVSAGYETSSVADDWLNTAAGRAALAEERRHGG